MTDNKTVSTYLLIAIVKNLAARTEACFSKDLADYQMCFAYTQILIGMFGKHITEIFETERCFNLSALNN